jgi:hypothetical protein
MYKNYLALAWLLSVALTTKAQLQHYADSVLKGSSDAIRMQYNDSLTIAMEKLLSSNSSFYYSFDSIPSISTLTSSDEKVRFYQWIIPVMATNSYQIKGMMQIRDKKTGTISTFHLNDGEKDKYTASTSVLKPENYFAAIYYSIIPVKIKNQTCYTLLGWRGVDNRTTIKVIDVLNLQNNHPLFGMKIFTSPDNMLPVMKAEQCSRIIFEYNAQAVMSLKYYTKGKKIVFDHISPSKPSLKGNEAFYGPDFSYDAFIWRKGKWTGKADVDIRNTNNTDGQKITPIKDSQLRK